MPLPPKSGGRRSCAERRENAYHPSNACEKIPARAKLHDEGQRVLVFVGRVELYDAWVPPEVVQYLHLPSRAHDQVLVPVMIRESRSRA